MININGKQDQQIIDAMIHDYFYYCFAQERVQLICRCNCVMVFRVLLQKMNLN